MYSGDFFGIEYYSYLYSGDFLNPNIIPVCIWVIFEPYSGDFFIFKLNNVRIRSEFSLNTIHDV